MARAFSKKSGLPFVQTSASEVFKQLGMSPRLDYPLSQRIEVQRRILDACEKQYRSVGTGVFVTDRTPIDMLAYMLADVQRQNVDSSTEEALDQYFKDCISVSNYHFAILMVVQPGISIVEDEDKAPANASYVEHINTLILGLTVSEVIESAHYYIPRYMTSLESRVEALDFAIRKTNERFKMHKEALESIGQPIILH